MSNKKEKKSTVKNTSRTKKIPMLKFGTDKIDINKIRISEESFYNKQHNAYKYYVLYDHNNEYMRLRITLKDLVGYYDVYNDDKRMNFKINYELNDKIYQKLENIFEHIEKKIKHYFKLFYFYEKKGENYFKIKVPDETCFKKTLNLLQF